MVLSVINEKIEIALGLLKISTRPRAGPGTWLVLLLPLAVILSVCRTPNSSEFYQLSAILCSGLLGSSITMLVRVYISKANCLKGMDCAMFAPAVFTSILLYIWGNRGILFSLISGLLSSFGFSSGILVLLKNCPRCFTFGEASVLIQSAILFLFASSDNIYRASSDIPVRNIDIATIILQVGILGIITICISVYLIPSLRSPFHFYTMSAVVLVLGVIPVLHILLQGSPVLWILQLLFSNIGLVIYWLACCGVAVVAVTFQISGQQQASTVVRKSFHALAVAVYIPGIITACLLLYVASGVVLALFVTLELFRILRMPPLGTALQDGFTVYADDKDAGSLALTPIYLLAGCSLPLWLHPITCPSFGFLLPLLSGVLAIGVGDTFASIIGTWFGHHSWPGTSKTIEGTLACILSQITVVLLLVQLGWMDSSTYELFKTFAIVIVTSIVEARTDQVDNLVLPLVTYILLV